MADYYSPLSSVDCDDQKSLLKDAHVTRVYTSSRKRWMPLIIAAACAYMLGVGSAVGGNFLLTGRLVCTDPSLALWSPANEAVRWKPITTEKHFFIRSPYVGDDRQRIDPMWLDLYDYGTSGISPAENSKLLNSTLPLPKDNDTYVVELQVFHDLHCLNMIRKLAYPEVYPEMWEHNEDGSVNHNSRPGLHIDHCIDSLRQGLMCTADVTPIPFHHNPDDPYHIFPKIWSTRMCRDFNRVKEWAIARQVDGWKLGLDLVTKMKPVGDWKAEIG